MAEDEIIKHTKAAYKAWKDPHKSWKHKIKEVLLEVVIIVFAVSLSIWFHNWSEDLRDRKEEKEFLTGLRNDLVNDTAELGSDMHTYQFLLKSFRYFRKVGLGEPLNNDSLVHYRWTLYNTTGFIPNISRFEALKGSGKLNIIENRELLNHILDLYQEDVKNLDVANSYFSEYKTNYLMTFVAQHAVLDNKDSIVNYADIFKQPQMRIYLNRGETANGNVQRYEKCIEKCKEIMAEIDEEIR